MTELYKQDYQVTWADLDANNHLRNSAYLDYASQTRFAFFNDHGFSPEDFRNAALGPVIFTDNIEYFRELRFLEKFRVAIHAGGFSEKGTKFIVVNHFYKESGDLAAIVHSHGAWFDLDSRKITEPPEKLFDVFRQLTRSEDFHSL